MPEGFFHLPIYRSCRYESHFSTLQSKTSSVNKGPQFAIYLYYNANLMAKTMQTARKSTRGKPPEKIVAAPQSSAAGRSGQSAVAQPRKKRHPAEKPAAGPQLAHLPLPPEIRDRIYKLVLKLPEDEHFPLGNSNDIGPDTSSLSLLLMLKQTYVETVHIFYRYNNLKVPSVEPLRTFLYQIGPVRRNYIIHISFVWTFDADAAPAFRLLQRCPNLRYVDVHFPGRCHYGLKNASSLRNVRGIEAVNFYGYGYRNEDYSIYEKDICIDVSEPLDPDPERWSLPQGQLGSEEEWNEFVSWVTNLRRGMMRPRLRKFRPQNAKTDVFKLRKTRFRWCHAFPEK